jgi:hypothetical protein
LLDEPVLWLYSSHATVHPRHTQTEEFRGNSQKMARLTIFPQLP